MATRGGSGLVGCDDVVKKLAAGSGYEYLTRQVAAADSTELGSMPLADYYAAKGEAPGRWIGSGLVGIDGLGYGDVVAAEQMKNLSETVRPRDRRRARPGVSVGVGGRVRSDVLAGEVGLGSLGRGAAGGREGGSTGTQRRGPRRSRLPGVARDLHTARGRAGPARSRRAA